MPVSRYQSLLQRRLGRFGTAESAEVPSEQFPRVAINDQGQRGPVVPSTPDPAHVGGPSLIWGRGDRGQSLDAGPESNRLFANLPAHDLEHALNSILVHVQQMRHGPVSKGWVLFDHGLDRLDELLLDLGRTLGGLVLHRAARNIEPTAELDQADHHAIVFQGLLKLQDHLSSSLPSREFNFFLHAVPASPLRTPPAAHGAAVRTVL